MKRFSFMGLVLVFSLALTTLFSANCVNAATNQSLKVYSEAAFYGVSGSQSSNIGSGSLISYNDVYSRYNSTSGLYVPSYINSSQTYMVRSSLAFHIVDQNNSVLVPSGVNYDVGFNNYYFRVYFVDSDAGVYYYDTPTNISIKYSLVYTDGTSSSTYSVSSSNFIYNYPFLSFSMNFTPEKDVTKIIITFLNNHNTFNEIYKSVQSPYYHFNLGSASSYDIASYYVEESMNDVGFLSSILNTIRSIISSLSTGFSNLLSRLNEVKSGIVDKLTTVQSGIVSSLTTVSTNISTMKDNLLTRLNEVKSGIVDKLTTVQSGIVSSLTTVSTNIATMKDNLLTRLNEVKSGIVEKLGNVGDSIVTMKDNTLTKLTEVKDGIVDKLKSVSDFFSFSDSGQSALDDFNSSIGASSDEMNSASDSISGALDEDINLDDLIEYSPNSITTYSSDSSFDSCLDLIVNFKPISIMLCMCASACGLGYIFFGKR